MTAFSTKISFVPRDSGVKSISFDIVDYGLIPFAEDVTSIKKNLIDSNSNNLHFRMIDDYYTDFVTVLKWEEFIEFHKKHTTDANNESINSFMDTYNGKVRYNWVIIEIYEWESGLE